MLMREMHWSWDQLQRTPFYVRKYSWDFLQLIFEKENEDIKRANKRK